MKLASAYYRSNSKCIICSWSEYLLHMVGYCCAQRSEGSLDRGLNTNACNHKRWSSSKGYLQKMVLQPAMTTLFIVLIALPCTSAFEGMPKRFCKFEFKLLYYLIQFQDLLWYGQTLVKFSEVVVTFKENIAYLAILALLVSGQKVPGHKVPGHKVTILATQDIKSPDKMSN